MLILSVGQQMADIAKRKAELDAETPEQTAAREKLRAELAAEALGLGKSISSDSEAEADEKGRDGLLAKPVTQTLKESMTAGYWPPTLTPTLTHTLARSFARFIRSRLKRRSLFN